MLLPTDTSWGVAAARRHCGHLTRTTAVMLLALVAAAFTASAAAAGDTLALVGATVHTGTGDTLESATVLLRDGRIVGVGRDLAVPAAARVLDLRGKIITPGFIDSDTLTGIEEVELEPQTSDSSVSGIALGAAFRVAPAVNGDSVLLPVTRRGGVTRVITRPEAGNDIFMGRGALVSMAGGVQPVTVPEVAMFVALGNGASSVSGGSRAAAVVLLELALEQAAQLSDGKVQEADFLRPRHDLEAIAAWRKAGTPLAALANRAPDIRELLRISAEQKLRLVVLGGREAWKLADELAAADATVVLDPLDNIPENYDSLGARLDNAAILHRAGVRIAFTTREYHQAQRLRQNAGNAVAHGLPWQAALMAITSNPAAAWGVADDFGRVAVGQRADLVVWDGDPLELLTQAEHVFIDGREVDIVSRQERLSRRFLAQ